MIPFFPKVGISQQSQERPQGLILLIYKRTSRRFMLYVSIVDIKRPFVLCLLNHENRIKESGRVGQ